MPSITFKLSGRTLEWSDDYENRPGLAEAHALDLDFGYRMGSWTAGQQLIESRKVKVGDPIGPTAFPRTIVHFFAAPFLKAT